MAVSEHSVGTPRSPAPAESARSGSRLRYRSEQVGPASREPPGAQVRLARHLRSPERNQRSGNLPFAAFWRIFSGIGGQPSGNVECPSKTDPPAIHCTLDHKPVVIVSSVLSVEAVGELTGCGKG